MPGNAAHSRFIRFATFELDPESGELFRQGRRVKIQGQPFEILVWLLRRPGEVVGREELKERLWPSETAGDFNQGLNRAINRVREALGDSAENPRFIETLPRRGYRFIGTIQGSDKAETAPAPSPPPAASSKNRKLHHRWSWGVIASVVLLSAALILKQIHWRFTFTGLPPARQIRSLAVLPLENLSNDPNQEYFADGLTDELITQLAKLGGVRVISRTSVMPYKKVRRPLGEIAADLEVDALVEGTVSRSDQKVKITAQLVEANKERHLWAESFERDITDIVGIQRDISLAIARQIHSALSPATRQSAMPPAVYDSYLKGRFFWNQRTVPTTRTAIEYFNRAIQADPGAALPYAGLADCYNTLAAEMRIAGADEAYAKATKAAVSALELDPALAEAHASLGYTRLYHDWDWQGAKRELERAIELNPSDANAHDWLSHYFVAMGKFDQSYEQSKAALAVDPTDPLRQAHLAWHFLYARQYDRAIEQTQKVLRHDDWLTGGYEFLGLAYEGKGIMSEAIAAFQKMPPSDPETLSALGHAYGIAGRKREAEGILKELTTRAEREFIPPEFIADVYLGLKDRDHTFEWLEKAYTLRAPRMIYLNVDSNFDPLRSDRRFRELVRKVGLPEQ
ncbi:MAG: winged helix-turn-helix domain-containing protein [Acidobacteriaceae bacterium]|nr:winged helix-turn-helix domain-containing protein [Acidobacteriaceae bacterium]